MPRSATPATARGRVDRRPGMTHTTSSLAVRAHANMTEAFASLPRHQPSGFVRRAKGIVVAVTGSPISLFNEVLPDGDRVRPEQLAAGVEEARQTTTGLFVQLREGTDDHLLRGVFELGLEEAPDFSWPAMALTELPGASHAPAGFDIRRVCDVAGYRDHLGATGGDPALTGTWMGPGLVDDPAWSLFVGYVDGVPVARSMAFMNDGVVGIYNVGTREGFRRRGYGWAMTEMALAAGAHTGCTVAILQSSRMGLDMYRRHGFRPLFGYRAFRGMGRSKDRAGDGHRQGGLEDAGHGAGPHVQ